MKRNIGLISMILAIALWIPGALEAASYQSPETVAVQLAAGDKVEVDLSQSGDPQAYMKKLASAYAAVSPYKASIYYEYHPSQPQVYRFYLKGSPGTSVSEQASLEKARSLLGTLTGPNDRATVEAIHHYLVANVEYDYGAYDASVRGDKIEDFRAWSPEGALLDGLAVCEGYSGAMMVLLDEADIPNVKVIGSADQQSHAWNMVYLKDENRWLHVDATRNDTQGQTVPADLPYLLVDDATMIQHGYAWDQASTESLAAERNQVSEEIAPSNEASAAPTVPAQLSTSALQGAASLAAQAAADLAMSL